MKTKHILNYEMHKPPRKPGSFIQIQKLDAVSLATEFGSPGPDSILTLGSWSLTGRSLGLSPSGEGLGTLGTVGTAPSPTEEAGLMHTEV